MNRLRNRVHGDRGMTLVESLVAMVLLGVIGTIVLAATISTNKTMRVADDETQGQLDVSVVVDRLSRDIRNARGVVCDGAAADPTCTNHLQLWADYNANYKQDVGETITWALEDAADGVHYDMIRSTDGGYAQVQARTIVENVAFAYRDEQPKATQPAPGERTTREVVVEMTYDAAVDQATGERKVAFAAMLRNVP